MKGYYGGAGGGFDYIRLSEGAIDGFQKICSVRNIFNNFIKFTVH